MTKRCRHGEICGSGSTDDINNQLPIEKKFKADNTLSSIAPLLDCFGDIWPTIFEFCDYGDYLTLCLICKHVKTTFESSDVFRILAMTKFLEGENSVRYALPSLHFFQSKRGLDFCETVLDGGEYLAIDKMNELFDDPKDEPYVLQVLKYSSLVAIETLQRFPDLIQKRFPTVGAMVEDYIEVGDLFINLMSFGENHNIERDKNRLGDLLEKWYCYGGRLTLRDITITERCFKLILTERCNLYIKQVFFQIIEYDANLGIFGLYSPKSWHKDREFMQAAIRRNGNTIAFASDELKSDRSLVLEAVSNRGRSLSHVPDQFRKDRQVVLLAVTEDGSALKFASEELKNDRAIVRQAIRNTWTSLGHASKQLQNDVAIVLEAVALSNSGRALFYASEEIRNNREFMLGVVSRWGYRALALASESLQSDEELIRAASLPNR